MRLPKIQFIEIFGMFVLTILLIAGLVLRADTTLGLVVLSIDVFLAGLLTGMAVMELLLEGGK